MYQIGFIDSEEKRKSKKKKKKKKKIEEFFRFPKGAGPVGLASGGGVAYLTGPLQLLVPVIDHGLQVASFTLRLGQPILEPFVLGGQVHGQQGGGSIEERVVST